MSRAKARTVGVMSRSERIDHYLSQATEVEGGCLQYRDQRYRPQITLNRERMAMARGLYIMLNPFVYMKGLFVAHTCMNKWCINPEHLVPKDMSDNILDEYRVDKGASAKLLIEEVLEIKRLLKQKELQYVIAERFNVSNPTIHAIATNKSWSWLNENEGN